MDRINSVVPEAVFKKYSNIKNFFANTDYTPRRFDCLYGMNINDLEISPLERTVIIAGIKSYLKQNDFKLSDTALETLHIQGITENELIAAPNFRCGYHQLCIDPSSVTIEHEIIQALLHNIMTYHDVGNITSSGYLSQVLLGESCISKEGAKFLGRVVLQEPHLILRIFNRRSTPDDTVFKEITKDHIIQSLKLNPELQKDYLFKTFNVENLEDLFNAVLREISQKSIKKEVVDDLRLEELAVGILQQTRNISDSFTITAHIKNDTKPVCLNGDINRHLLNYLSVEDIISLLKIAIESLNVTNNPTGSLHEPRQLTHQMSTLGLEEQASSRSIRPVESLIDRYVGMVAETRNFS